MSSDELEVDVEGAVGYLRLNRPGVLNALSLSLMEAIIEVCADFNERGDLKVVVVSGSGRAFSSGVDLGDFTTGVGDQHLRADLGRLMAEAVESIEAVTIAQIHGYCIGGGIVLGAACDLAVAANDVGAINYYADIDSFDLWGLSNLDTADARISGRYGPDEIRALSAKRGVKIALVYTYWFQRWYGGLPSEWQEVGQWEIAAIDGRQPFVVSFYAVDPDE
ncbi:MAG: enoyl-CoA hydratase/isomerase family protein, partial [Acidimicrobiales bacterium]